MIDTSLIFLLVGAVIGFLLGTIIGRRRARGPAEAAPPAPTPSPSPLKTSGPDSALLLLGILQREARLVDFLEEDVAGFSDAQVGAAARVVHQGARKAIREHFTMAKVKSEPEGQKITVPSGFDAREIKLTGNVVGEAPFTGTLRHNGWRVTDVRLPDVAQTHDARVLAPAEVEL